METHLSRLHLSGIVPDRLTRRLMINDGSIDHGMVFVSWTEIAVGVIGNDCHLLIWSRSKAVQSFRHDGKDIAGIQWLSSVRQYGGSVSTRNNTDPNTGMRMRLLVSLRWKVERIETGITPSGRRDQQRIGASINVPEPTDILDGPTTLLQRFEVFVSNNQSRSAGNPTFG